MGEIHKLTKDGITLFPATTTDAVVHPQVRTSVSNLITEYNVTSLFPTSGSEGTSEFTLQGAISLLYDKLNLSQKIPGIKILFTDFSEHDTQEWRFLGGNFTDISNWSREDSWYNDLDQNISDVEDNLVNDALRKTEQSLTSVEKDQVKKNLNINLEAYKVTWSSTEDANNYINPGIYTITGYRVNPEDNLPLANSGANVLVSGTLIVSKANPSEVIGQTLIANDSKGGTTNIWNRTFVDSWTNWKTSINEVNLGNINAEVLNTLTLPGIYTGAIINPVEITSDIDVVLSSSFNGNTQFKLVQTINENYNNLRCSQILYLLTNLNTDLVDGYRTSETLMIRTGNRNNISDNFTFGEFTSFITKAYLDTLFNTQAAYSAQVMSLENNVSELQETVNELELKNSTNYCVSAWEEGSLSPSCIETYGSLDFCDQWDFYLIDTTDNTESSTKPVGKLMRNNLLKFEDGSWAPTVGITKERKAECDVALFTSNDNGITLEQYCNAGEFNASDFYDTYGMNTKLYNIDGVEVNILRPWETVETKYTICLGRDNTIYLLDNVLGDSGKRWKGIFAEPITWDGIDVSKYELKPTGISPGPSTVINDGDVDKLRNFFYLYEGNSSCGGYKGLADCEVFRYNRTWPVSYDYTNSNGYRVSQISNMKWARNNNLNQELPVPFAEGGFFALNSYLTSYEVFYGTKYLHSPSRFTGNIFSSTPSNESTWKSVGNIRIKESNIDGIEQDLNTQDWLYKSWGSYIQSSGYYYKSDASDYNITWSSAINNCLPKEQCMESQMAASFAAEMKIPENTEFDFYGNTYWYKNVPETIGLENGRMNVIVYKLITGNIGVYKYNTDRTSVVPVTLKMEIIIPVGLVNGANLCGDIYMYWGGGYEIVGTKNYNPENSINQGDFPISIYLEPDQNNWVFETKSQRSNDEVFKFEDKYSIVIDNLSCLPGEGYCLERTPFTGFSIKKGGGNSTGECAYHWSGNNWDYSSENIGYYTRIGACFRSPSNYGSYGFRASNNSNTIFNYSPSYSASIQISLNHIK